MIATISRNELTEKMDQGVNLPPDQLDLKRLRKGRP
jgi:hypothetical protein